MKQVVKRTAPVRETRNDESHRLNNDRDVSRARPDGGLCLLNPGTKTLPQIPATETQQSLKVAREPGHVGFRHAKGRLVGDPAARPYQSKGDRP